MGQKLAKPRQPFTAIIAAGFIIAGLYLASDILIPFAFAVLLAFLAAPLANRLEKLRLGRIASVIVTVVIMLLPLAGLVALTYDQVVQVMEDLPEYRTNLRERAQSLSTGVTGEISKVEKVVEELEGAIKKGKADSAKGSDSSKGDAEQHSPSTEPSLRPPPSAEPSKKGQPDPVAVTIVDEPTLEDVGNVISPLLSPLGMFAIVSVLVLFILLEREDLRNRAIILVGRSHLPIATKAIDEAGDRVSRYLRMQLLVNSMYGIAVGILVWILDLPNPLFWAVAGTAFRFIPYIGPWFTAGGVFLLSLAVTAGWTIPAIIAGSFVVFELVVNNILEPWLYGSSAGLTSIGVISAAIFWTWLWGAPGLFLATPITVCICVLGRYFPQFEFAAILLSDDPPLPPESRFYQRLLAVDSVEANRVVEKTLKAEGLASLFDKLLMPTLVQSERDFQSGDLGDDERTEVHEALLQTAEQAALASLGENADGGEESSEKTSRESRDSNERSIVCVPGHGLADETSAQLVAEILTANAWHARASSDAALCGEVLQQVAEIKPEVVLISTLSPFVGNHARYLCKRLRQQFPGTPIILGVWMPDESSDSRKSQPKSAVWQASVNNLATLIEWLEKRSPSKPRAEQQDAAVATSK